MENTHSGTEHRDTVTHGLADSDILKGYDTFNDADGKSSSVVNQTLFRPSFFAQPSQ